MDAKIAAGCARRGYTPRGGLFSGLLGDLPGESLVRAWWMFLRASAGVGALAIGFGISFPSAPTLAAAIAVALVILAAMMPG